MKLDIPQDTSTSDQGADAVGLLAQPWNFSTIDPVGPSTDKRQSVKVKEESADNAQPDGTEGRSHCKTESTENGDDNASVQSEPSQEGFPFDLRDDMLKALDSITSSGTFANAHKLGWIIPGLVVEDVGLIDLPLRETQAKQMISKARHAPYGKGSETIVDTSVRNTWELDPSQFQLTATRWPKLVAEICQAISEEAGLGGARVHAHLYKMLIYEKGAMFKAHTDTENVPGMFGTLVICLPSPHEGGNVVTKHCGVSKTFRTDQTRQSYLWWFSDVSHEVLPVLSGYRVVLTYNLAIDASRTTERPSAALARNKAKPVRHALRLWLAQPKQERELDYLYYALDHQYTEANISHAGLKTRDLAIVDVLHQLSAAMPFYLFLAVLEKEESGSCERRYNSRYDSGYGRGAWGGYYEDDDDEDDDDDFHDLEEVFETSYRIKKLVDLGGRQLGVGSSFDLDNVLQWDEDLFPEDPESEDYEQYMGNSGPSATHWYRASAVVIVPRDHLVAYLLSASRLSSLSSVTDYVADICLGLAKSDSSSASHMWNSFYHEIFEQRGGMTKASSETKALVLTTTLRLKDWVLWGQIIASIAGKKYDIADDFFSAACEDILSSEVTFDQIEQGMSTLVSVLPTLARQHEVVRSFVDLHFCADHDIEFIDKIRTLLNTWARQAFTRALAEERPLEANDGCSMINIAFKWFDLAFFKAVTIPIFKKRIRDFGYSLEYLNEFRAEIEANDHGPNAEECRALYRSLATSLIDDIDASLFHSPEGLAARATAAAPSRSFYIDLFGPRVKRDDGTPLPEDQRNTVTREVVIEFLRGVLLSDLPLATIQKLFYKLTDQAGRINRAEFHPLWLPILRSFLSLLEERSIPLTTPRYQHFCAAILESYIVNYLGKEPTDTSSLAQPAVDCSCADCRQLNAFLVDPRQKVGRFAVGKQRRQHLHRRLEYAGIDFTHKTERFGNPQTLVVTKTLTQQAEARTTWKTRAEEAKKQFELFDQGQLRTLLGSDFSKIIGFEDVRAATRQQSTPAINLGQRPQGQGQGQRQPGTQVRPLAGPHQTAQQPLQHGLSQQPPRSLFHSPSARLPDPVPERYQIFDPQSSFASQNKVPPHSPVSQAQQAPPVLQAQQSREIMGTGVLPNSKYTRAESRHGSGVLKSASGNQVHQPGGALSRLTPSHAPEPLGIKQERGEKRKASELEPDIIDLTVDD